MPTHLLDTNVILRFLIGDDPPKAARAAALMSRVESGEQIIDIPDAVLTETVWTLESFYKVPRRQISEKMAAFVRLSGIRIVSLEIFLRPCKSFPIPMPTSSIASLPRGRGTRGCRF